MLCALSSKLIYSMPYQNLIYSSHWVVLLLALFHIERSFILLISWHFCCIALAIISHETEIFQSKLGSRTFVCLLIFCRFSCHIADFFAVSIFHHSYKCCSLYFRGWGVERLKKTKNFFLVQLVSAQQRVSILFPLCKFCSVANLIFKCFACHVCLE